jgi:hypothetical protein
MAHLVETMAYTGQTPWHELGHALPAKQSIDVWAQAAGMDWRIQETPVRYLASDADSFQACMPSPRVPEQKVLYRSDTKLRCRWWAVATRWCSPVRCWSSTGI